jgi:hypothetical protein
MLMDRMTIILDFMLLIWDIYVVNMSWNIYYDIEEKYGEVDITVAMVYEMLLKQYPDDQTSRDFIHDRYQGYLA